MVNASIDLEDAREWLVDAPLFMDTELISLFYEAVVGPQADPHRNTLGGRTTEASSRTTGSVEALAANDLALAEAPSVGRTTSSLRQLQQLAAHYVSAHPDRLAAPMPAEPHWYLSDGIERRPRLIVLLDFPRGTMFVPMALELQSGRVIALFEEVKRQFAPGCKAPEFPDQAWYADNWDSQIAMKVIETEIVDEGRIEWIDYRTSVGHDGTEPKSLHLHVAGRGNYSTGTFAYYLVQRAFRRGIRLVGTMKTGPAMNVLAVFEK